MEIVTNEPASLDNLPDLLKREKLVAKAGGRALTVQTSEPAKTIVEAVKWIDSLGLELVDIHLKRPTLEDVFIELTGRRLREQ